MLESTVSDGNRVRGRIDPESPWRYACKECGSVRVKKLKRRQKIEGKTYAFNARGWKEAQEDRKKIFRCESCQKRYSEVLDKKYDTIRSP